jgi:hypothetical protein
MKTVRLIALIPVVLALSSCKPSAARPKSWGRPTARCGCPGWRADMVS